MQEIISANRRNLLKKEKKKKDKKAVPMQRFGHQI
jgi:hypothetical protein